MNKMRINKYWILIFVGIVSFLALFIILIDVVAPQQAFSLVDFIRNMLTSIPFALLIAIVDYQLVKFINRSEWFQDRLTFRIIIESLSIVILAILFVVLGNILVLPAEDSVLAYLHSAAFYISATVATLINIFTVTILEYFVQIKRNNRLQKENLQMQYQQLKNQINPHFLFNSLNVLVSLINKDGKLAIDYTQKLSEVYRYVLSQDDKNLIYVADEIVFIQTYIEILKIRFGDALSCKIELDNEDQEFFIPPMSLQLLVENAVKHNIVSMKKPLIITITSTNGQLTVSNNINLRTKVEHSSGVGLKNLDQKYRIISTQGIQIENDHEIFKVKLPLL